MNQTRRVVAYYRVSTEMQGESGLGLEAQKSMVHQFIQQYHLILLGEFEEVDSGGNDERPILHTAIQRCQERNTALVVAKIDRLSRNASFSISFEETYHIPLYVAELGMNSNRLLRDLHGIFAQFERGRISERVHAGIERSKRDGTYKNQGNAQVGRYQKKARIASSQQAQEYRKTIYRELEWIHQDLQAQQRLPTWSDYVEELTIRDNKTRMGKAWTVRNLKSLLGTHRDEWKDQYQIFIY